MGMNRRNVLVGLGGLTVGGGALFASGAFTTVEAQRTVELSTTGDAEALLSLADGGSQLVRVESGLIRLDEDELNEDALTRADNAIDVDNNGEEDVGFYVEDDNNIGEGEVLNFYTNSDESIVGSENAIALDSDAGETTTVGVEIELRGNDEDAIPDEITFVADTEAYPSG